MKAQSTRAMTAGIAVLMVGVAAVVGSPALAAPPPAGDPATSAYVEQIPTSSGLVPSSGVTHGSTKLAKALADKIAKQGGTDAAAIKRIAKTAGPPTGTAAVPASGNTGRLVALLAVLGLIALGLVAIARHGRRGGGSASTDA